MVKYYNKKFLYLVLGFLLLIIVILTLWPRKKIEKFDILEDITIITEKIEIETNILNELQSELLQINKQYDLLYENRTELSQIELYKLRSEIEKIKIEIDLKTNLISQLKSQLDIVKNTKLDCALSEWGEWSNCDKECGGGIQYRKRYIKQMPYNGGKECDVLEEQKSCNTQTCIPVNCKLSDWSSWTECNKKCGNGNQYRTRTIIQPAKYGGKECSKNLNDSRPCNNGKCK